MTHLRETDTSSQRAYFYCVATEGQREVPYQHLVVALAEGLTALGVACFANVDYWPLDVGRTRYLLHRDPDVGPEDCSIVFISDDWIRTGHAIPEPITQRTGDACCIALDRDDGARLPTLEGRFRVFDFILRTHFNAATRYRPNFAPWAYGLTERIVASTAAAVPVGERRWSVLANWRHTAHPHSLRLDIDRALMPKLRRIMPIDEAREAQDDPPADPLQRLWWRETGRRHWPAYYERLGSSAACACFGGYYVTGWPAAKESPLSRALKRMLTLTHLRTHLISQWDSWRLWESFAAASAVFHVDLEAYGCRLPVMPVNGEHYIGFDLDRCDETLDRIREEPAWLQRVGLAGRAWALEHYGPPAVARRVLDLVRG